MVGPGEAVVIGLAVLILVVIAGYARLAERGDE